MVEEYDSIMWNNVWDVVPRLVEKSVVTSQWIYKVKQAADGSIEKHKARFVARGFSQVKGIKYDETFAPVARYSLIRSILALSAHMGWKIHQMDVKTSFLNGEIEEEVYIEHPEGFKTFDRESHGVLAQLIKSCKEDLAREIEMKDMGLMHYFLGMEAWQRDGEVFVSQGKYANEILRCFHMEMCKPMETPLVGNWSKEDATSSEVVAAIVYWQLGGSLMYLVNTQPDLCFVVNQLSQYMIQPTKLFWKVEKHVLRYLKGTTQYGLCYKWTEGVQLQGFTDANWVGVPSDRKSTFGGIFNLGSAAISWYSRKQRSVALSSAEAEYMAASQAACEAI
eukprot:PITA_02376